MPAAKVLTIYVHPGRGRDYIAVWAVTIPRYEGYCQVSDFEFEPALLWLLLAEQSADSAGHARRTLCGTHRAAYGAPQSTSGDAFSDARHIRNKLRIGRGACNRKWNTATLATSEARRLCEPSSQPAFKVSQHFELKRPCRADCACTSDDADRRYRQINGICPCAFRRNARI